MPDDVGIVKQERIVAELDMVSTCAANGRPLAGRKNYLSICALQGLTCFSLGFRKTLMLTGFLVRPYYPAAVSRCPAVLCRSREPCGFSLAQRPLMFLLGPSFCISGPR